MKKIFLALLACGVIATCDAAKVQLISDFPGGGQLEYKIAAGEWLPVIGTNMVTVDVPDGQTITARYTVTGETMTIVPNAAVVTVIDPYLKGTGIEWEIRHFPE